MAVSYCKFVSKIIPFEYNICSVINISMWAVYWPIQDISTVFRSFLKGVIDLTARLIFLKGFIIATFAF